MSSLKRLERSLAMGSYVIAVAASLCLGGLCIVSALTWFGVAMNSRVTVLGLVTFTSAPIAIVLLVYVADVAWLLMARFAFSRDAVDGVLHSGRTSRLDRWLVDRLVPRDSGCPMDD